VQLLAAYTNPESQNAQRHRQTDGQTDRQQAAANSRSYCVAVRSAKNEVLVLVLVLACPVFVNITASSPPHHRPLWLHLCIWSNPKPATNVRQECRPLSALWDESGTQGHSRSSLLVPAGIQNRMLS